MNQFLRKLNKILMLLRVPLWRKALKNKVAATTEHLHIFTHEPFSTLIDVGANRGQFSLMAKGLYPEATVFAFEPLSLPRKQFELISRDWTKTTIFPYGIGEESIDSVPMNVSQKNDSSSILEFDKIESMFDSAKFSHTEEVSVKRLDEVITSDQLVSPVLMKIDVQGYEKQVIESSNEILPHVDIIYVEAAFVEMYKGQALFDEIYSMLLDRGFFLKRIGHVSGGHGQPGTYGDFLFSRK